MSEALKGFAQDEVLLIQGQARQPQTSVSLQALMRTGRGEFLHRTFGEDTVGRHAATELVLIQVAGFLRRELPIRLAHRLQDLQGIPVLKDMPSVQAVCDLYAKSFLELEAFDSKIQTVEQEEAFAVVVEHIYERHSKVLVQMARGAFEFRQAVRANGGEQETQFELQEETHAFLDRFYLCRIGIRVLIGQYLALREPPVENYVGIICSQTSPYEIVKRAIDDAAFMCTRKYGDAPEVIMSGSLDLTFPYVPTHLRKYFLTFVVYYLQSVHYCQTVVILYRHAVCKLRTKKRMTNLLLSPLLILFYSLRLHHVGIVEKQHARHGGMARRGRGIPTH
jgi:hypothetical protein